MEILSSGKDSNGYDIDAFDWIGLVQDYEQNHFGQIHTDLSKPELVANACYTALFDEIFYDFINDQLIDLEMNITNEHSNKFKVYLEDMQINLK